MHGISQQVPLAETDKSASYAADSFCHPSAAADVVTAISEAPNAAIYSHGGAAHARGPMTVWVVRVICDSAKLSI